MLNSNLSTNENKGVPLSTGMALHHAKNVRRSALLNKISRAPKLQRISEVWLQ